MAYGNAIIKEIKEQVNREVSLAAAQVTLYRWAKGYYKSRVASHEDKEGRRKRIFTITPFGTLRLRAMKEDRWSYGNWFHGWVQTILKYGWYHKSYRSGLLFSCSGGFVRQTYWNDRGRLDWTIRNRRCPCGERQHNAGWLEFIKIFRPGIVADTKFNWNGFADAILWGHCLSEEQIFNGMAGIGIGLLFIFWPRGNG